MWTADWVVFDTRSGGVGSSRRPSVPALNARTDDLNVSLNARIDALHARIDAHGAKIDALSARMGNHIGRPAG
ncbi:MAG: hypothetical protein ACRDH0_06835 [Actinomycetota bacterium]